MLGLLWVGTLLAVGESDPTSRTRGTLRRWPGYLIMQLSVVILIESSGLGKHYTFWFFKKEKYRKLVLMEQKYWRDIISCANNSFTL